MSSSVTREHAQFWQAQELGNLEVLHASYLTHTFTRHTHDRFAISMSDAGAGAFYYQGAIRISPAPCLNVLNPGEVHDGRAADQRGWAYRMIYPDAALLQRIASEVSGRQRDIPFFPSPILHDDYLLNLLHRLHLALTAPASTLERETRLRWVLAQLILRHAENRPALHTIGHEHQAVRQVREYIDTQYAENMSLEDLAGIAGLSPFHLLRVFQRAVGLPPHAYLTQVRVAHAKRLLSSGCSIAQTALHTGFVDQSHLTKHFKRFIGVTPGQFMQESKNLQDRHL